MTVVIEKRRIDVSQLYMELLIKSDRFIWEIQRDFTDLFGFLKIEFFSKQQQSDKPFAARNIFSKDRRIADLTKKIINSTILIYDEMTVSELERLFTDQFNLSVQVFRRSGNIWLETTMTDGWTLKQQNEHGKEITNGVPKTTLQSRNLDKDVQ